MFFHNRAKTIRRQPIINGGMNVEIGNPSYNMYEVDHSHNDGTLLDPNFIIELDKVIYCLTQFIKSNCLLYE